MNNSIIQRHRRNSQPKIGPTLLEHALQYAEIGWPVFPVFEVVQTSAGLVCSCGNPECKFVGKHPRTGAGGLYNASTDPWELTCWWSAWPNANIGMHPGKAGLLVIDFDIAKPTFSGHGLLASLRKHAPTYEVATGGGGAHLYYTNPYNFGSKTPWKRHEIDVRGVGGYVLLPPSNHKSGRRYQVTSNNPVASLPEPLVPFLASANYEPPPVKFDINESHIGDMGRFKVNANVSSYVHGGACVGFRSEPDYLVILDLVRQGATKAEILLFFETHGCGGPGSRLDEKPEAFLRDIDRARNYVVASWRGQVKGV